MTDDASAANTSSPLPENIDPFSGEEQYGLEGVAPAVAGGRDTAIPSGATLPKQLGILRYKDGGPVVDPNTGQPYPKPPGMDVTNNVRRFGFMKYVPMDLPKDAPMAYQFWHGQPEDYQRPPGSHFPDNRLRNVTNYNYGAVAASMGYALPEALAGAGAYNRLAGRTTKADTMYGIRPDAVKNISQGWSDYKKW